MPYIETIGDSDHQAIDDPLVLRALNAIGRSINLMSTYGNRHPAFLSAISDAMLPVQSLFLDRQKIVIGTFNGVMTIDDVPVITYGVLLKSLERRLVHLRIKGLRISRGISEEELIKLVELLTENEAETFQTEIAQGEFSHVVPQETHLQNVREDEVVASKEDLAGIGTNGVLVIDDDELSSSYSGGDDGATVHVEQIVAFLKGDVSCEESGVGEMLAADPDSLGQLIMESVVIRQAATELNGESVGDIVLGCLRRTYEGLRQQPAFQSSEGMVKLKKSLLLLEESMLEKMRSLAGDTYPELDRQIVQTFREMDEDLGFELAANQYVAHKEALKEDEQTLLSYVQAKGVEMAEGLISDTEFPASEWRRIVVESHRPEESESASSMIAGLDALSSVFEKLETLVKSKGTDERQIDDLFGQANESLDETLYSTQEKLELLSAHLGDVGSDTGTIGGQAMVMDRKELLSSISEIAQELMQPLTVITASLELLLSGDSGAFNHDQMAMLEMASNSGRHLAFLMNKLIEIVGCPVNTGVDDRFHTTSEQLAEDDEE